jgi:hypothetical protein
MKNLAFSVLLLTFSAYAMDHQTIMIVAKLKEPMEKLQAIAALKSAQIKLSDVSTMYECMSREEQNAYMKERLTFIQNNLKECKEMLDEERQNARFWFFHPNPDNDESEMNEENQFKEINQDIKDLALMFELNPNDTTEILNPTLPDANDDSDSASTVSLSSSQANEEIKEALFTYAVNTGNY